METGQVKPLVGTEGGRYPFFSPNGDWIGFNDVNDGTLKKIAIAGGAPIQVCKTDLIRGATWLSDDTIVFGSMGVPLQRVSSGGGVPVDIVKRSQTMFTYWPSALPDGQHVLYMIGNGTGNYEQAQIAVLSLRDGQSRVIVEGGTSPRYARGHVIYSHSGTLFAVPFDPDHQKVTGSPMPIAGDVAGFSSNGEVYFDLADDGTLVYVTRSYSPPRELVWVNRKGEVTPASDIRREYSDPRISPDGQQIAVAASADVWLLDLKRQAWTRLTTVGQNAAAMWSPDGRQIFFASNRNGPYSVYAVASDGSGSPQQLTHDLSSWTFPLAISRDSRNLVLLRSQRGGAADLWVVNPSQADTARRFLNAREGSDADLSPDSRWIAFSSNETGQQEIYLSAFPSPGRKWPVSIGGGEDPRFRPDGHELFYRNGNKMMAVAVTLGPEPHLGKPVLLFEGDYEEAFDVTEDGQRFVMVRSEKRPPTVQLNAVTDILEKSLR